MSLGELALLEDHRGPQTPWGYSRALMWASYSLGGSQRVTKRALNGPGELTESPIIEMGETVIATATFQDFGLGHH